jgi:hypothetical protein
VLSSGEERNAECPYTFPIPQREVCENVEEMCVDSFLMANGPPVPLWALRPRGSLF